MFYFCMRGEIEPPTKLIVGLVLLPNACVFIGWGYYSGEEIIRARIAILRACGSMTRSIGVCVYIYIYIYR